MSLQIVADAKQWWIITRKLWLLSVLERERKGLPPRPLAKYAAERAQLLHQELPPDPWGATARRKQPTSPASASSSAAMSMATSTAILPVCQASMVTKGRRRKEKTMNNNGKKKRTISGHKLKTSEEQPPNSSMLRSVCTEGLESFRGMLWT